MNLGFIKDTILKFFSWHDVSTTEKQLSIMEKQGLQLEYDSLDHENISEVDKRAIENFMQEMLQNDKGVKRNQKSIIEELKSKQIEVRRSKEALLKKLKKHMQ